MNVGDLNQIQQEAVEYVDSPVLIFAGAGSGKTRVLTHKVAYLIQEFGMQPENVLAVTFTNKAANELRARVDQLLSVGDDKRGGNGQLISGSRKQPTLSSSGVHVGTFHAICAKMLRQNIQQLGYRRDFVIYDTEDQQRLLKTVIDQNDFSTDVYSPGWFQARISWAKNHLSTHHQLAQSAKSGQDEMIAKVYADYQKALKANQALDFDDLLLLPLKLFKHHPRIRDKYRELFQYILVDEYQDTNQAQFALVKTLAAKHQHICVVGDDDQSIYSWRGADITNILNFTKVFKKAKVFKLEQNYRSSEVILKAASSVVEKNKDRAEKQLWTEREGGELIHIFEAEDDREEAENVLTLIQHEVLVKKRRFRDIVILYRTNAQSRALEDALRRRGISYIIVGGIKFYDRKEVKDILAYLRLLINPDDSVSLERVINFPPRGVGDISFSRLRAYAMTKRIPLFEALDRGEKAGVQSKQSLSMAQFKSLIERYSQLVRKHSDQTIKPNGRKRSGKSQKATGSASSLMQLPTGELISALLEETGIVHFYKEQSTNDSMDRLENINELLNSIDQYFEDNPESTLSDFLEEVSLLTDIDRWNDESNAVTLMTLHSAKGLEFPVVIMTGLEEGLFPLIRNDSENPNMEEEERRLFYVGLTRAEERAYMTFANRRRRGSSGYMQGMVSRFIRELPPELVEWSKASNADGTIDGKSNRPRHLEGMVLATGNNSGTPALKKVPTRVLRTQTAIDDFVVESWVEHRLFGRGQIIGREGTGDNLKLTIKFGNQIKKLVAHYANLVRL